MKVLKESSEKITVEFQKPSFYIIQNFFLNQKKSDIENHYGKEVVQILEELINLPGTEEGLFNEIEDLLNKE